MLELVPKPDKNSAIFLDTSVLIDYLIGSLDLEGYPGLLEKRVREFVSQFISRQIPLRITQTVRVQAKSWQSILTRNAREHGVPPYLMAKLFAVARTRYDKLQGYLREENASQERYPDIQAFYRKHETDEALMACRNRKKAPTPLPEDSDMKILAEVANYIPSFLIAADCDYYSVDEKIATELKVYVLSQENMNRVMQNWGWL